MKEPRRIPALAVGVLAVAGYLGTAVAQSPPDSELNPRMGYIESVYETWDGTSWDVEHVIDSGQGGLLAETELAGSALDELAPRIAIKPDGEVAVVWWCDDTSVDKVFFRNRAPATGRWSEAARLSAEGDSSSRPAILEAGAVFWVAFEFDAGDGETGIAVNSISENPEPYPTALGATAFAGDLDVLPHSGAGHVWVTWVDGTSEVGWSEYDSATDSWSLPGYESYAADDVAAARARIRDRVTGG